MLHVEEQKRLEEIDTRIKVLQDIIQELMREKHELLGNCREILDSLPARAKNALERYALIKDDMELQMFINGQMMYAQNIPGLRWYERAETKEERLAGLRNVGKDSLKETIEILKEKGLY